MLKRVLLLILLILWAAPLFAQSVDTSWVRRHNGPGNDRDITSAIWVDSYGNVYVTGVSQGYETYQDYATIKYNHNGDTAWIRRYDGTGDNYSDDSRAITVDDFGNVYVTGVSNGYYMTIKYDGAGNMIWGKSGPTGAGLALAIEKDIYGNIYVTGLNLTIKYDTNGTELWIGNWGGSAITLDTSMNVLIAGSSNEFSATKYYNNGDTAWVREYTRPDGAYIANRAITLDNYGNVYLTGSTLNGIHREGYGTVKYDSSGNFIWSRFLYRYNCLSGYDITTDVAGNIYVTGGSCYNYTTVKYDQDGNEIWLRKYDCQGSSNYASAITMDSYDNVYVTGICNYDFVTVKYNSSGIELWAKTYDGWNQHQDKATDIAVDDSGCVYVTGYSTGENTGYDYLTIKYVQFMRADVNKDSLVNIIDVVYFINYFFNSGPAPVPAPIVGDATCDSNVDINDVIYLIDYIFKSGPAPCI
jgi:hypothetical protein